MLSKWICFTLTNVITSYVFSHASVLNFHIACCHGNQPAPFCLFDGCERTCEVSARYYRQNILFGRWGTMCPPWFLEHRKSLVWIGLKWTLPPPWQHQWCHSIQFFIWFQKKLLFFFYWGEQGFWFLNGWFLVKNLKTMNHLKTITMVSMETKFASQDSILDKLSEKLYLSRFWEGEQGFTSGGGHPPPPPPPNAGAP